MLRLIDTILSTMNPILYKYHLYNIGYSFTIFYLFSS
nr:MAG TPA: hypothetical protein [Caudoviricetes sp.]DAO71238.1 MAG TPA: hypothetical protein [Caudoviricetes sp.]